MKNEKQLKNRALFFSQNIEHHNVKTKITTQKKRFALNLSNLSKK